MDKYIDKFYNAPIKDATYPEWIKTFEYNQCNTKKEKDLLLAYKIEIIAKNTIKAYLIIFVIYTLLLITAGLIR